MTKLEFNVVKYRGIYSPHDLIGLSSYLLEFMEGSKYLMYERKQEVLRVCGSVRGRANPTRANFKWKYFNTLD